MPGRTGKAQTWRLGGLPPDADSRPASIVPIGFGSGHDAANAWNLMRTAFRSTVEPGPRTGLPGAGYLSAGGEVGALAAAPILGSSSPSFIKRDMIPLELRPKCSASSLKAGPCFQVSEPSPQRLLRSKSNSRVHGFPVLTPGSRRLDRTGPRLDGTGSPGNSRLIAEASCSQSSFGISKRIPEGKRPRPVVAGLANPSKAECLLTFAPFKAGNDLAHPCHSGCRWTQTIAVSRRAGVIE